MRPPKPLDQQRNIAWQRLLTQATRASDNDYNPAEFLRKLRFHYRERAKPAYARELPVTRPLAQAALREFIRRLAAFNQAVAQATLRYKPPQP
jgi:hypothetical protein